MLAALGLAARRSAARGGQEARGRAVGRTHVSTNVGRLAAGENARVLPDTEKHSITHAIIRYMSGIYIDHSLDRALDMAPDHAVDNSLDHSLEHSLDHCNQSLDLGQHHHRMTRHT